MSIQTDAIRKYLDLHGIRIKDLADALEISSPAVSNMLADRDKIGAIRARKLRELYGFDYHFLMTGEGELFPPKGINQSAKIGDNAKEVTIHQTVNPQAPSMDELVRENQSLKSQLEARDKEIVWLRSLVDKVTEKKE